MAGYVIIWAGYSGVSELWTLYAPHHHIHKQQGNINMGKSKEVQETGALNESQVENEAEGASYEEKLQFVNAIAQPMASKKLAGRVYKLAKKGKESHPRVPLGVWRGSSRGGGN